MRGGSGRQRRAAMPRPTERRGRPARAPGAYRCPRAADRGRRPACGPARAGAAPLVAVDAMGGDHAPAEIVAGAVAAASPRATASRSPDRPARPAAAAAGPARGPGRDLASSRPRTSLGMDEGALASWRRPRSSIAVACQLVRRGQAAAVMSAGSTGAIVATARLRLRPLPGVARPALAVVLPDPAEPDRADRRGRHRRPQAGDAGPVRPARRGLRAGRAAASPSPGSGC